MECAVVFFWGKKGGPPLEPQCQQMTVTYSRKATQKENDLTPQPRARRRGREWEKTGERDLQLGGEAEGTIKSR